MMILKMMMPVSIAMTYLTMMIIPDIPVHAQDARPGGGDDEKKEESAESREEAQEQVAVGYI